MVKNEVYFRAVLIVSTLVLGGIASAYILRNIIDVEEEGDAGFIDQLRKEFISASLLEPGSSNVIRILDPPSGGSALISVGQGGVFLKNSGKISRILVDNRITPSRPPVNVGVLNGITSRRIGIVSGGYSIMTPVELNFTIHNSVNSTIFFIHPEEIPDDNRSDMVVSFLDRIFIPEGGWKVEMDLEGLPHPILDQTGLILIRSGFDLCEEGACSIPIVLPIHANITLQENIDTHHGPIRLTRFSEKMDDGTFKEIFEVTPQ